MILRLQAEVAEIYYFCNLFYLEIIKKLPKGAHLNRQPWNRLRYMRSRLPLGPIPSTIATPVAEVKEASVPPPVVIGSKGTIRDQ
jgi:hypothetical protein